MSVERDFPWLQAEEQQQRAPFVSPDPNSCPTGTSPACPWLPLGWDGGSSGGIKHLQHLGGAWTHQTGSGKCSQSFSWRFPSSVLGMALPRPFQQSGRAVEQGGSAVVLLCLYLGRDFASGSQEKLDAAFLGMLQLSGAVSVLPCPCATSCTSLAMSLS